ncbi:MAG: KH domain-containing protein [Thermomicrobiales bacterium]
MQINLRVSAKELGKVIGREGRIARSMRTIVMVAGSRNNVRANLDIDGNA